MIAEPIPCHCSERTAAELRDLGWEQKNQIDVTMFVHDHDEFVEFWDTGAVVIGEFSGQSHWTPITITGGAWKEAWRHIVAEMHS